MTLTTLAPPAAPAAPAPPASPVLGQATRFLVVGGVATAVDVALFNLLLYGLGIGPLTSKVASTAVAATVAFVGNRQWSFDGVPGARLHRQLLRYLLVTVASLGVALLPLAFARYALGLTGVVALNTAGNVVGLVLATAFRFWAYRRFVFTEEAPAARIPWQRRSAVRPADRVLLRQAWTNPPPAPL